MDFLKRLVAGERALRLWLWASLVCNMGIIVTGAIVRLTKSGLGCPTWPQCTDSSYVPHGELGWHGVIEFGNRTLTFVLILVAAAAFISAIVNRGARSPLFWLTLVVLVGIPFQGVIGGLVVLSQLNPWVVALHLLLSVVLIVLCVKALLMARGDLPDAVGPSSRILAVATFVLAMLAIWVGTVVTGAGPHAGDENAKRNGLEILMVTRIHSATAWLLVAATLACVWQFRRQPRARQASWALLAACLIQGAIGYAQYFTGVPIGLVIAHMAGLTLITAAASWLLFATSSDGAASAEERVDRNGEEEQRQVAV